jgi:hypothetical protein
MHKDLHGITVHAIGRTRGPGLVDGVRGVAGAIIQAIQVGEGIATNELEARNLAGGGHARSLVGVYGIAKSEVANNDSTHTVYGVSANMCGYRATAAFRAVSVDHLGQPGWVQTGLHMGSLVADFAGIIMPASPAGTETGTIISMDANDYYHFHRANNQHRLIVGGAALLAVGVNNVSVGVPNNTIAAHLYCSPGTSSKAQMHLADGVAKTSPINGDWWREGNSANSVRIRLGGVTYSFVLQPV